MMCTYHFLKKKKKKKKWDGFVAMSLPKLEGEKNSLLFPHNPNKRKLIVQVSEDSD